MGSASSTRVGDRLQELDAELKAARLGGTVVESRERIRAALQPQ
ncbi:hypothetical protein [Streptomyces rubrolavendulae]|nr:hypothetical protein [Streptomyces rubrolavendulae]